MREIIFDSVVPALSGLSNDQTDKPLLLALHGWLDNAASFLPLSKYLSQYHIVALDFAGHGKSAHRPAGAHYHLLDYVHDLHQVVEQQRWTSFTLLGHSMGGIIATLYAATFPEYIEKLITIESFGPLTKPAADAPSQLKTAIESRIANEKSDIRHPTQLETVVSARQKAGDMSRESAQLLVSRNLDLSSEPMKWKTDRKLRTTSSLRLTEPQAEAFMSAITCPVLTIMGTKGFDMMKKALSERQSMVKQLKIVTCQGGHHLHMDNPLDVAEQIIYFLEQ
ncbi:alpha/beta hydrolase [Aestuariibacter sp. AA17]|uniref:Alpha/beta hydrolase n=1 Tax=Fluctibacter corallii TaxID=2984329 RepID=A0ABT3A9Z2_9ALTE|nr:alpha/beta hydrolase [Aestuariibacter sp. AA17]MCV2885097.1 alpha/beta hydrolase [Aestuariibacter sp. AA17]